MNRAIAGVERRIGRLEFTSLLAMSMALAALGIDLMLPVFPAIREEFGLPPDSTAVAGLVTAYFLGLAAGQVVYGPLADRFGRRPTLYLGFGVYAAGALLSALSPTLGLMLWARFVWGLGAAGPRVVTLAVVRDSFDGEQMSRAMSFIMAIFILVPVVAPSIGALIGAVASWRWVFGACVIAVAVMMVWGMRLPETLREEHRRSLRLRPMGQAARFVVSHRQTAAYTLALTALYGVLTSYLASSEIIFVRVFGQARTYPIIFGGLAAVMGLAMLLNARVVGAIGTRRLSHGVLIAYVFAAGGLVALSWATGGVPPLAAFIAGLAVMLFAHALLIPNFNTIAMAPMAEIAGVASSVIGAVQISIGALLGAALDRAFDGTVHPLSVGFLFYGVVALLLVVWAENGRLFRPIDEPPVDEVPPVHVPEG